jgi:hypothetical protein
MIHVAIMPGGWTAGCSIARAFASFVTTPRLSTQQRTKWRVYCRNGSVVKGGRMLSDVIVSMPARQTRGQPDTRLREIALASASRCGRAQRARSVADEGEELLSAADRAVWRHPPSGRTFRRHL